MARRPQPPVAPLGVGVFVGATTIILQGAIEQQRGNHAEVYHDLFAAARLVAIFVLLMLSILLPSAIVPNILALATVAALRLCDLYIDNAETVAAAAAALLMSEAAVIAITSTAPWSRTCPHS